MGRIRGEGCGVFEVRRKVMRVSGSGWRLVWRGGLKVLLVMFRSLEFEMILWIIESY